MTRGSPKRGSINPGSKISTAPPELPTPVSHKPVTRLDRSTVSLLPEARRQAHTPKAEEGEPGGLTERGQAMSRACSTISRRLPISSCVSGSMESERSIFRQPWWTVEWSRPPRESPISTSER